MIVSSVNEMRLMVKIAYMYHEQDLRQKEIAEILGVHQTTISRFLRRAQEDRIVRTTITPPPGIFATLEGQIEERFGLKQVVVVDSQADEEGTIRELGSAAAFFVESTTRPGAVIGISSWSRSLFAMMAHMHATGCAQGGKVVQLTGGGGRSELYQYATRSVMNFASLIGAQPILLHAPGIVESEQVQRSLGRDGTIRKTLSLYRQMDLAIVGIGSMEPAPLMARSGNAFSLHDRLQIQQHGAVGNICLRFYDRDGNCVESEQNRRVMGIELEELLRVEQVVGVASGASKIPAIVAALRSRRVHVLITDRATAGQILRSTCLSA